MSLYGVSLGGNLVAYLISKVPTVHAAVMGAPAPIWFLGVRMPTGDGRPDFSKAVPDPAVAEANIAPICACEDDAMIDRRRSGKPGLSYCS